MSDEMDKGLKGSGLIRRSFSSSSILVDSDAMSYFRAVVTEDEKSPRTLELTEHIIRLNPAHYTVW
jgi:hypothetical protein